MTCQIRGQEVTTLSKYFNLTESYMHTLKAYDSANDAYLIPGLGRGGSFEVDKVSKKDKLVTIDFHYYANTSKEILKKVTLVVEEGQEGFKYLSCKTNTVSPLLAGLENIAGNSEPKIVLSSSGGWSYTDRPKVYWFNPERDILGLEFSLNYDAASEQYELLPAIGDEDKIISYTLTGTKFTIVLNGKYKIGYPNIPLYVGINHFINKNGYWEMKDSYEIKPPPITRGEDGNYYITVPFNKTYKKGEITFVHFTFGKID